MNKMNSRERVAAALRHEQPDRAPLQLWMTSEISKALQEHFSVDSKTDVLDAMDIDVRWLLVDYVGPELKVHEDGSRENEFGMRSRTVVNEFGSYEESVFHPLAEAETPADVANYRWPDPDWWDYSSIGREIETADRVEPRWLGIGYASLFERAWGMTGFEKLLLDMAINPPFVEAILDQMLDFYIEQTSRILQAAGDRIDMLYIADDVGSQNGLLMSPGMFQQSFKGRWKTFIDTIKARFGGHLKFHYHSCGAVSKLVPDLMEMGIDILNPIQPLAVDMEPESLKERFGEALCFSGGLDIQELLPRGTAQEVRADAKRLVSILGKSGGYIAGPAHAVQPDTSVENVLAMLQGFKEA